MFFYKSLNFSFSFLDPDGQNNECNDISYGDRSRSDQPQNHRHDNRIISPESCQAGQPGGTQTVCLQGLSSGLDAAADLFDDAAVCDHGVGVAVEGGDCVEFSGQNGLRQPVLRRYIPEK